MSPACIDEEDLVGKPPRFVSNTNRLHLSVPHANSVMENKHKFDPTVIFRDLSIHKRDCFIKLGLFMLSFFYYLYRYAGCGSGSFSC